MATLSTAPGHLDQVRAFLNTWRLPHETRTPEDRLPDLVGRPRRWRAVMPDVPPAGVLELEELTELRSALRQALGQPAPRELRAWLERHPVLATIGDDQPLAFIPRDDGTVPLLLASVVDAVAHDQWSRLKACPDCRHVFYDHSRNRTRTWCGMYVGTPGGRACGSIAKVRAYRERQRAG